MDPAADDLVLVSIRDRVAWIHLNRPDRFNVFSRGLAERLLVALDEAAADGGVRVIVLRGEGEVFSAGGDVRQMLGDVESGGDPAAYFQAPLAAFHRLVLAVVELPKPIVAAVHGAVAGFAFNLVLACDLVIAAEGTRFTQAFRNLGLSPDGGGTWFLPRIAGRARAAELALLPTVLDAATAREWGLVNRVVPTLGFERETEALAAELAAGPAPAMVRAKALLNRELREGLAEQLEEERQAQIANAAEPDFGEGLRAFLEKRPPRFR